MSEQVSQEVGGPVSRRRYQLLGGAVVLLCLIFGSMLVDWVEVALGADLHSHVLLIPVVTLYLIHSAGGFSGSPSGPAGYVGTSKALPAVLLGVCALGWVASWFFQPAGSKVDSVALRMLFFLCGIWGSALGIMGWRWVKEFALFPLAFLSFMIPLPGFAEVSLEHGLMVPSAWVSEWLFDLGGIPVHRAGQFLELPGLTLEVAEECSGIRSTLVLLITGILAAHLFLKDRSSRWILVLSILPLGVLRNAVRIYVIGWLCVNYGADQIDSWIHRKGGPVFFAVSLIPLLALAGLLWKLEAKRRKSQGASSR